MSFILVQEIEGNTGPTVTPASGNGKCDGVKFYVNDLVCRIKADTDTNTRAEFGVVCFPQQLPPDQSLGNLLQNGFTDNIPVFWIATEIEHNVNSDDIFVVQRDISVGMTVQRDGLNGGRVINSSSFVVVRCVDTGQVFVNVPIAELQPVQRVHMGDVVMHAGWLGMVVREDYSATIVTDDGYRCHCSWNSDSLTAGSGSGRGGLKARIKYTGQSITLSKSEALFEVTWEEPIAAYLSSLTRQAIHGRVVSKQVTLTCKWIEQIGTGFHPQCSPPANTFLEDNHEFAVVATASRPKTAIIGSINRLLVTKESSFQVQTYEEWLKSLCASHKRLRLAESTWNDLGKVERCSQYGNGDAHRGQENKNTRSAVLIWKELRGMEFREASTLTVEVLCVTSWVTVSWPSVFLPLDYLQSCEVEPVLFTVRKSHIWQGCIVKFSKLFREQPATRSYFGQVVSVDDTQEQSQASVRWYHIPPGRNPILCGTTNSRLYELELHPEWNFREDDIVIVQGLVLEGHHSVGRFHRVTRDGLFVLKLLNGTEWKFCPTYLRRLELNCAKLQCDIGESRKSDIKFKNARVFPKWSPSLSKLEQVSTGFSHIGQIIRLGYAPAVVMFSEQPAASLPGDFYRKLQEELSRLNGGRPPAIWMKTFICREDIFCVAMEGPPNTLYEDCLFFFTVKIPESYPKSPPLFFYHSFSPVDVNPCLKPDGSVLCPLLNTYPKIIGQKLENWDPDDPSIAVILLCIQKIMLGSAPYENDPEFGLFRFISTSRCNKLCRKNNLKYLEQLIVSVTNQLESPPSLWVQELYEYYRIHVPRFSNRVSAHLQPQKSGSHNPTPTIPLPKLIRGNCIASISSKLSKLRNLYERLYEKQSRQNQTE